MIRAIILLLALVAGPAAAADRFTFNSIDGGHYDTATWRGQPVLVVNTASLCAFTPQFDGLQALHDTYADRGLVVLAVPSDDFRQELGSEAEVKEFCRINFDLTLPMTTITQVRGRDAHPFYQWLAQDHGVTPAWNFHKVLIGPDGAMVASFGSSTKPDAPALIRQIEALLAR